MAPLGEDEARVVVAPAVLQAARLLAEGNTEAAVAILSPLVVESGADTATRLMLGFTAWKMGRLDWALQVVRECHEDDPMDGTVAETLASLHAQAGNFVDSFYFGKLATALGLNGPLRALAPAEFPSFDRAFLSIKEQPRLAEAKLDLDAGHVEKAIENARQHVALHGEDAEGRAFYAVSLLRASRPSEAVDALRAVETCASENAPLASLYARALAAIGRNSKSCRWHLKAEELAPNDAAIAAARIADGTWCDDIVDLDRLVADWAARFGPPRKSRIWHRPDSALVIAYTVPEFGDRSDAAAIAAVARAHDRRRVKVLAFGSGAQSWDENTTLSGAFDIWRDTKGLDAATIARYLRHDGVDVVIDASGFAAPQMLLAIARTTGAFRVSWLGNPSTVLQPFYDARMTAQAGPGNTAHWSVGAGYPIPLARKRRERGQRPSVQFGVDATLPQFSDEMVACWTAVLGAIPDARLLFRTADAAHAPVDRLVEIFGREFAARIDLVAVRDFEEFYSVVDVALAPRRGVSPRMAAEALACGVPVVAFAGVAPTMPYASFLDATGFGASFVAVDADDYVRRALALAVAPSAIMELNGRFDAESLSRAIEDHAFRSLEAGESP